jgi:hypothetical protein
MCTCARHLSQARICIQACICVYVCVCVVQALQELLNRDVIEAYVISAGHVGNCFCDDVATVEGALLEVALAARRLHAAADFLLEQWRKVQTS